MDYNSSTELTQVDGRTWVRWNYLQSLTDCSLKFETTQIKMKTVILDSKLALETWRWTVFGQSITSSIGKMVQEFKVLVCTIRQRKRMIHRSDQAKPAWMAKESSDWKPRAWDPWAWFQREAGTWSQVNHQGRQGVTAMKALVSC